MRNATKLPVSVKCRLGVDDNDTYPELVEFVKIVSQEAGVSKFIVHARKAFLKGLNPKANRKIPPLNYNWVLNLKSDFPDLEFVINGGFDTIEKV
jgi:tRNA-dihydrouridine synthase A